MLARNHTILGIYRIYSISRKRAITDFKQEGEEKSYSVAPLFLFWSLNSLVLWKTLLGEMKRLIKLLKIVCLSQLCLLK